MAARKRAGLGLVAVLAVGVCGNAGAQVVLPADRGSIEGTASNSIPVAGSVGRYLVVYDATLLGEIAPGSYLTSMRLRLDNSAASPWPASSVTVTRFDVTMASSSRTAATISTTYANNIENAVVVRSGALDLAAGAYPAGANAGTTPEGWGPEIRFATPYKYAGGPLVIDIRTTGAGSLAFGDMHTVAGMAAVGNTIAGPDAATGFVGAQGPVVQLGIVRPDAAFQNGVTKVYLPEKYATVDGGAQNFALFPSGGRTVQSSVAVGEIDTIGIGSGVVGYSVRNSEATAWPPADTLLSQWDMQMSFAITPPSGLLPAINMNQPPGAPVVKSGGLLIPAGAMAGNPPGPVTAPFTFQIPFSRSYTYLGGPLLTVLRTQGSVAGSVDSIPGSDPDDGSVFASLFALSANATSTPIELNHPIVRLSVDAATRVPSSAVSANQDGVSTPFRESPRTMQVIVSGSELTHIPKGSLITGLSMRQYRGSTAAWPPSAVNFALYKIEVSTSQRRPGEISLTIAENEGSDKIVARDGPLVMEAGTYAGGALIGPNAFGPTIQFQRGFVYRGGDLCLTVRHSGSGIGSVAFADIASSTSTTNATFATSATAASAQLLSPPVLLLSYTPSVALPRAFENVDGPNGYAALGGPGVLQTVFGVGEMRHIPAGSLISGISLRKSSFGALVDWPAADLAVDRFDVTLASSPNIPAAMSDTFASNIGSDAVVARSGPIVIPARALPASTAPTPGENEWFIEFQRPYRYLGGPMSVTIRHTVPEAAGAPTLDVNDGPTSDARSRTSFTSNSADAAVSDSGGLSGPYVTRFAFVPRSFCVADLNGDGFVDDTDFVEFTQAYDVFDCGASLGQVLPCPADFTFDGFVDDSDFVIFAAAYSEFSCPP